MFPAGSLVIVCIVLFPVNYNLQLGQLNKLNSSRTKGMVRFKKKINKYKL